LTRATVAKRVTIDGVAKTFKEWELVCGIGNDSIRRRYAKGIRGELLIGPQIHRSAPPAKLIRIEIDGQKKTYAEWAKYAGIPEATFRSRYGKGVRGLELIIKPTQARNRSATGGGGLPFWERVSRSVLKECQWLSYEDADAYECTN